MKSNLAIFEDYKIRRLYDEKTETWYFSVVDIIQVLIQQPDFQKARKYWNKLKERLKNEGNESVSNCHRLKLEAANEKNETEPVTKCNRLKMVAEDVKNCVGNKMAKKWEFLTID
jgi:DNA-damage-inducible protein D